MTINIGTSYRIELRINNVKLDFSQVIVQQIAIHESVSQALPTVDMTIINDGTLINENPLVDGSQIDLTVIIEQNTFEEEFKIETVLWSHEIDPVTDGYEIKLHCVLSAPDFIESRIESIDGSSFDVFRRMADRSRMTLIGDPSIDRQVWLRPGIRGNVWLNNVINHSWSSPDSHWAYAVTRKRELLKYNLRERAARNPTWNFKQRLEDTDKPPEDNDILYSYPRFSSQSGFLNSFFGYGRNLSNFDIEEGARINNNPSTFTKRVRHMNVNRTREVSQRLDSLGYGNSFNQHENYFNAFAQNMRMKSFYSVNLQLLSSYFRDVRLLDRVSVQLDTDPLETVATSAYSGNYFVEKIVTIINTTDVVRKFNLVREGYTSEEGYDSK